MDETINWNDIKQQRSLQFTTIDDPEIMKEVIIMSSFISNYC